MAKRGADEAFDEPDHAAKIETKRSRRFGTNNAVGQTKSISKTIPSETVKSLMDESTSPPPAKTISDPELALPNDDVAQQEHPEQQKVRSRKNRVKHGGRRKSAEAEDATETASADVRSQDESKAVPPGASWRRRKIEQETSAAANDAASPEVDLAGSVDEVVDEFAQNSTKSKKQKKKSMGRRKRKRKKTEETTSSQRWTSSMAGGRFLSQDPLLAQQGQYLILPTKWAIQIYSAATSLLVRSLPVSLPDPVTSCALCPGKPNRLLVATLDGQISEWDWTSGQKQHIWQTGLELVTIIAIPSGLEGREDHKLLALCNAGKGEQELRSATLTKTSELCSSKVLLKTRPAIPMIRIGAEGATVVICADRRLMLGSSAGLTNVSSAAQPEYTWREISLPEKVTCFDVRARQAGGASKKQHTAVDIVLGTQHGPLLIYDDLLSKLSQKERGAMDIDLTGRQLLWHRNAVGTVKWSRDGNYVISGGNETVLVIWQLDTGQKQTLPHLAAPIQSLTVSATGAAYAMRLADNSSMVLSTADLLPTTNINGVCIKRDATQSQPFAVDPKLPDHILMAAPTNTQSDQQSSATMLQTYDCRNDHHISRQALARNVVTVVNTNDKGHNIIDPDVLHLQLSHDGLWLATVDQWKRPKLDTQALHLESSDAAECEVETCLRFWSWDSQKKSWQMSTRIDEPHKPEIDSVLAMSHNASRAEFTTAGKEGNMRIWRPMMRMRNGLAVRDQSGEPLLTWTCAHALQPDPTPSGGQGGSAALAYSDDGSTIAVSWCSKGPDYSSVHFVDSRTGQVRLSQAKLCPPGQAQMVFSGSRLLLLSNSFHVWDVVKSRLLFGISFKPALIGKEGCLLAANSRNGTFAIAMNPPDLQKPATVAVLGVDRPEKILHTVNVHGHVRGLQAAPHGTGYVILDGEARITQLTSDKLRVDVPLPGNTGAAEVRGLKDIFGSASLDNGQKAIEPSRGAARRRGEEILTVRPTAKSLDDIFSQQAYSAPLPVADLFERVARLYARPTTAM